jgi:uncharacterized protein YebE (UPF0316 family)
MLLVKDQRFQAAAIGFFEVIVYITALVQWYYLLVYALGFAGGNLLGGYLEERMALGYVGAQIIVCSESDTLVRDLEGRGLRCHPDRGMGQGRAQGYHHSYLEQKTGTPSPAADQSA